MLKNRVTQLKSLFYSIGTQTVFCLLLIPRTFCPQHIQHIQQAPKRFYFFLSIAHSALLISFHCLSSVVCNLSTFTHHLLQKYTLFFFYTAYCSIYFPPIPIFQGTFFKERHDLDYLFWFFDSFCTYNNYFLPSPSDKMLPDKLPGKLPDNLSGKLPDKLPRNLGDKFETSNENIVKRKKDLNNRASF